MLDVVAGVLVGGEVVRDGIRHRVTDLSDAGVECRALFRSCSCHVRKTIGDLAIPLAGGVHQVVIVD
ncbi:hypothetical protein [Mycolicibacterium setense]|uniref:hypothetical protein n=1 Tax=Mycolicibacterium setense TaxID=431269 RepID=UPI0010396DCA|nr:hypothetical protein [Mycolicibacterium setense]